MRLDVRLVDWIFGLFRPKPAPPPAPAPAPSRTLFDILNEERSDNSLPPFLRDAGLDDLAQSWAQAMDDGVGLDHGDFKGRFSRAFPGRIGEENIAWGQKTPDGVVLAWMRSPGHRANILNRRMTHAGCGRAGDYWCTVFAT